MPSLARAFRFFRPEVYVVGFVLLAGLIGGVGLLAVSHVHAARQAAEAACRHAVRGEIARNPIMRRAVLPADPCRALRVLRGEDA